MPWKRLPQPSPKEEAELEAGFKKKAAFLLDESVDPVVAGFLKEKGWNVRDVSDLGLFGQDDETVLAAAHRDHSRPLANSGPQPDVDRPSVETRG